MSDLRYREPYRPQFHFTAGTGWLNDPNGLVFYDGEYHLFFQHNPTGTEWGNMTWGHAVSEDLVHWRQLPHAIAPYNGGTIFSGSAVVDRNNSSGFGERPMVAAFTHAHKPYGQALAYSLDKGRSWQLHDRGRPVVENQGLEESERDPKVFWHEPSQQWVMVLWVQQGMARIFNSNDLKRWRRASDFVGPGFYECPDLFELGVDHEVDTRKWVLHDAGFNYWVGAFDGEAFTAEAGPLRCEFGPNFYAAQTWNGTVGRTIQIAWMRGGKYPGMPFNQQMSFPCRLALHRTAEGLRLRRTPVAELSGISGEPIFNDGFTLKPGTNLLAELNDGLYDIQLAFAPSSATAIGLRIDGQDVRYSFAAGSLASAGAAAHLEPDNGEIELRLLVDRTSLEVFGNRGTVSISSCFLPNANGTALELYAEGGAIVVKSISVRPLASIWDSP